MRLPHGRLPRQVPFLCLHSRAIHPPPLPPNCCIRRTREEIHFAIAGRGVVGVEQRVEQPVAVHHIVVPSAGNARARKKGSQQMRTGAKKDMLWGKNVYMCVCVCACVYIQSAITKCTSKAASRQVKRTQTSGKVPNRKIDNVNSHRCDNHHSVSVRVDPTTMTPPRFHGTSCHA